MQQKKFMLTKALKFAAFGVFEYFRVFFPLMLLAFFERALMVGSLSLVLGLQIQKSFTQHQFSTVQLVEGAFSLLSLKVFLVIFCIYSLFMLSAGFVSALLTKAGLMLYDTRTVGFKNLQVDWNQVWYLTTGMYIYTFFSLLGYALFIIPGFLITVIYGYYRFFIIDKNMGPIQAFKASAQLTNGSRVEIFMLLLILNLFNFIGLYFWGLGLFITLPLGLLAQTYVYRRLLSYQ